MRNKAFIAAILTLGIGLGTIGVSTQAKDVTGGKQYNKIYNTANDKKIYNLEEDNDTEGYYEDEYEYETLSFEEFLGEDINYFNEDEIEKLKGLYEIAAEYELNSIKAWDEFQGLFEGIVQTKGIELFDFDNEECGEGCEIENGQDLGEDDGQDYFLEFLQEIKEEIGSELYEKLSNLYEKGISAENEENYEEADEIWNAIDEILKDKGYNTDTIFQGGENEELFASFNVVNGKIEINKEENIEKPSKDDMIKYELLWERVKRLVPKSYMNRIAMFNISSDGKDGVLAYVHGIDEKGEKWAMSIDKKDAIKEDGNLDNKELNHTIIHEFAHILTLNNSQMKKERNEESITYTTDEGTTNENSYLNKFYNKFWKNIHNEWTKSQESEDTMMDFYNKYEKHFVSDYASTNIEEDIAESFTHFVTQDKPKGNSVKDQKIKFFYEFDEMLKMRNEIRENLKSISALK